MFAGYYSYQLNDNPTTRTKWIFKNVNADLATLSGTDAFQVYYLKDIPDFFEKSKNAKKIFFGMNKKTLYQKEYL